MWPENRCTGVPGLIIVQHPGNIHVLMAQRTLWESPKDELLAILDF